MIKRIIQNRLDLTAWLDHIDILIEIIFFIRIFNKKVAIILSFQLIISIVLFIGNNDLFKDLFFPGDIYWKLLVEFGLVLRVVNNFEKRVETEKILRVIGKEIEIYDFFVCIEKNIRENYVQVIKVEFVEISLLHCRLIFKGQKIAVNKINLKLKFSIMKFLDILLFWDLMVLLVDYNMYFRMSCCIIF